MTKEEKELLLKDLCCRIPYGVKGLRDYTDKVATLHFITPDCKLFDDITSFIELEFNDLDSCPIQIFKPYLRSLSSMTEEEKDEYIELFEGLPYSPDPVGLLDWLNAHHFDYRGLIEKGLAIAVTEENNPYKE